MEHQGAINPDCPLGQQTPPSLPLSGEERFSSPPDKGELEGFFEPIPPNELFGINGVFG